VPGFAITSTARTEDEPTVVTEKPTFAELFVAHVRFVWRVLAAHGVPSRDLDDAAQEVFLVVHRRMDEWDPGAAPVRAWLHAIAIRVAANQRRLAHHRHEPSGSAIEPRGEKTDPGERIDRTRALTRLDAVLETLDERKRQVFVLYEIEEISMQEIADIVGCPVKTAYARLYAAREQVLAAFERSDR
jgi:RNA polymerase sigma-70 factor (ECF subfamily)